MVKSLESKYYKSLVSTQIKVPALSSINQYLDLINIRSYNKKNMGLLTPLILSWYKVTL